MRGDTGPANHSAYTLNPTYSILTNATGYTGAGVQGGPLANPNLASQYCNGSRVPPENGGMGYAVPPGISDATIPNPLFSLTPAATVDEGNNWINMTYGPLSLTNPTLLPEASLTGPNGSAANYGNYSLTAASTSAIGKAQLADAPPRDFFGTQRTGRADIGAVEFTGAVTAPPGSATLTPDDPWLCTARTRNCPGTELSTRLAMLSSTKRSTFTLTNTGTTQLTGIAVTIGGTNPADFTYRPAMCMTLGQTAAPHFAAGAEHCTITHAIPAASFRVRRRA